MLHGGEIFVLVTPAFGALLQVAQAVGVIVREALDLDFGQADRVGA